MTDTEHPAPVSRRGVLRTAAVGGVALPLLSACGGGGTAAGDSATSPGASGSAGSGSGPATVPVADVPVGGGKILADAQVVVTQPAQGEFKAFSAICTHRGCTVGSVTDGEIVCPCHGSHFSIKDGAPVSGPAPTPLAAKKVSVAGGELTVG